MLAELNADYPWLIALFILAFGACWGSFLNVVIYRLPLGKSVVRPGSACTRCGQPIRWFDNIPVLSWLLLCGKSRCCKTPFSIRYPLVEAATAVLFLSVWHLFGAGNPAAVATGWLFVSLLLCGALIDYDTQMLPDIFTVWGMVAGVLLSMLVPALHGIAAETETVHSVYGVIVETTVHEPALLLALRGGVYAVIGAIVGAGTLLWIAVLTETVLRREAMGFGDVLLMGCIGAFCGWQGSLFAIFGGALIGCCGVVVILFLNKIFGLKLSAGKTTAATATGEAPTGTAPENASGTNAAAGKAVENVAVEDTAENAAQASVATATGSAAEPPAIARGTQATAVQAAAKQASPAIVTSAANGDNRSSTTGGAGDNGNGGATGRTGDGETDTQLGFGVAIPFGPWLAAGALLYFLFFREATAAYFADIVSILFPQ